MVRRRSTLVLVALVVFTAAVARDAEAQVKNIGLNLFTPGARPNGMGRAFIGVADDASAAITNPAGLTQLTLRQATVEFKSSRFEGLFGGAEPTRINTISFADVSFPVGEAGALAFSRHEFLHFREDVGEVTGVGYAGSFAAGNSRFAGGGTVSLDYFSSTFAESATRVRVTGGGLWKPSDVVSLGVAGATGTEYIDLKRVPGHLGGGVGIRPESHVLVTSDVIWIDASDPDAGSTDVVELHFGGEVRISKGNYSFFPRAGGYMTPKKGGITDEFLRDAPDAAFTVGFGIIAGRHIQVDVAYISTKDLVLSSAVRF